MKGSILRQRNFTEDPLPRSWGSGTLQTSTAIFLEAVLGLESGLPHLFDLSTQPELTGPPFCLYLLSITLP
jgi:hypothetical protein